MGKKLYEESDDAKNLFHKANEVLGFDIAQIMFEGTEEDLKKTSVTQPAVFLHSTVVALVHGLEAEAAMMAGHSLGEFSALVAAGVLDFEPALQLVATRANAMQKACDAAPSTMGAIIGLEDEQVENMCTESAEVVVPANYNSKGQLVISGSLPGVEGVIAAAKEAGAKVAKLIPVNGAFHSPFMEPAGKELEAGIRNTTFSNARVPVYQNVTAAATTDADQIQENLISQLTSPVRWTQTIENMIADGAGSFLEVGPGNVLQGLIKRIDRKVERAGRSS